jgi:GDPmannose 4,6-dehydratase
MWMMLQDVKPDDYVVATGETHSVKEFVEKVFGYLNMDWQKYVEIDPKYFRPAEVDLLLRRCRRLHRARTECSR